VIGGINTLKVVQFAAQNLKMDPTQSGGTIFKLRLLLQRDPAAVHVSSTREPGG
jgi:hypothetical protein